MLAYLGVFHCFPDFIRVSFVAKLDLEVGVNLSDYRFPPVSDNNCHTHSQLLFIVNVEFYFCLLVLVLDHLSVACGSKIEAMYYGH